MTEKRFTIADGFKIVAVRDNGEIMNSVKVIDMLNTLNDENNQLKKTISMYSDATKSDMREIKELMQDIEEIQKENEQLKQRNNRLEEKIQRERISFTKTHERWSKEAETKIKELGEKNEQLKSFIKKLTSNDGKIWLMNGHVYKTDKILKGDVE